MKYIAAIAALIVLSGCAGQQVSNFTMEDSTAAKEACKDLEGKKKSAVNYEACYTSTMLTQTQARGAEPTQADQYMMAYRANLARQIDDKQITREQANLQLQQEVMKISQAAAYDSQMRGARIANAISDYGYRQQQYYQGLNQQNRQLRCTSQNFSGIVHTNCY